MTAMPPATMLRFPHAPDAEPNAVDVAAFVAALAETAPDDGDPDEPRSRQMRAMIAAYGREVKAGPDRAAEWEEQFRSRFPEQAWRMANPPAGFPAAALEQWRQMGATLTFAQRSQLAFALFVAPVLEATLDRFGVAALRNPRLQVDPFAGGEFDLPAHLRRLLNALDDRIAADPYPEQVRRDRQMRRLIVRFARRCNLPLDRGPSPPHHRRP